MSGLWTLLCVPGQEETPSNVMPAEEQCIPETPETLSHVFLRRDQLSQRVHSNLELGDVGDRIA